MEQVLLLAPMTGALVAGLGWRLIGETAVCWISTTLILIAATLAWFSVLGAPEMPVTRDLHIWIESGSLSATIAFRLDRQYAPLIALVTSLAAILHIVTLTYFRNQQDEASPSEKGRRARLCAGLGGMTVALVLLLAADDMAQFLAGWVGIGLACYIISGLNLGKAAAGRAAQRVALTLRTGELLLLILVGGIFALTDTLRFDDVFQVLSDLGAPQVTFLGMDMPAIEMLAAGLGLVSLLMAGQIFFLGWLCDASEAPLPGAVMILTAGPILAAAALLLRMGPVLELAPIASDALVAAAIAGTVVAASSALAQSDIMRVLACLASAQAGFVIAMCGLGASLAATGHLFCASLALAALAVANGVVAGRSQGTRELDKLGAQARAMPLMLAASVLAAATLGAIGIPGTFIGLSGYLSYGAVFAALANTSASELFWAGMLSVGLCSLAAWRLVFRIYVFAPQIAGSDEESERPDLAMSAPVLLLALAGAACLAVAPMTPLSSASPDRLIGLAGIAGLVLAALFGMGNVSLSQKIKNGMPWLHAVFLHTWYVTPLLSLVIVSPVRWLSEFVTRGPEDGSEQGAQPGILRLAPVLAQQASKLQGGLLAAYSVALGLGLAVLILWILLMRGAS